MVRTALPVIDSLYPCTTDTCTVEWIDLSARLGIEYRDTHKVLDYRSRETKQVAVLQVSPLQPMME